LQLSPTPTALQLSTTKVGFAPSHDSFDNFPWVDPSYFEGHVVTEVSGFLQMMSMSDALHLLSPTSTEQSQKPFAYVMQRGNLFRDNLGNSHAATSTVHLFFPSSASKRQNIQLHPDIGQYFYQAYAKSHVVTRTMHPGYQAFRDLMCRGLTACFGKENYAAKELLRPTLPTQATFAGLHRPPSLVITVPIQKLQEIVTQAGPGPSTISTSQPLDQPSLGATVMDSSEATISTQDQLATAAVQALLKQQLALVRQEIQAEVTAQLSAVDSRISSVEEVTSHTQREVSLLQSQSREMFQELKEQSASMQTQTQTAHFQTDAKLDAFKEEARLQREQSQSQFQAMMTAMAELTHSKRKDT
jgi:hypothetical protein